MTINDCLGMEQMLFVVFVWKYIKIIYFYFFKKIFLILAH